MITIWRRGDTRNILVATWKVYDFSVKTCPAHNFVIWSSILQLFHKH